MEYTVEMGSRAMIYMPVFIKTGSGIPNVIREYRQDGDRINLL
jgi:hypothetical protein